MAEAVMGTVQECSSVCHTRATLVRWLVLTWAEIGGGGAHCFGMAVWAKGLELTEVAVQLWCLDPDSA